MMAIPIEQQFMIALQLILAGILCTIIGWERERSKQEAGLRTHILVGMGSCLFTSLSIWGFQGEGSDPSRVASQILPGLGFLGAGAILKQGANIQGLTTAASMWVTAALGMAVGTGAWFVAICATLLVWFVLHVLQRMKPEHMKHE